MKALILAAGYGTRLLPYTRTIPKPLFTLNSAPIIAHLIKELTDIGCEHIFINTHHLHEQLMAFAETFPGSVSISCIYEPAILDTGGAIANARAFLEDAPFFVINADIISNVNLLKVYNLHQESDCLATLVLHNYKKFNKIKIDYQGYIESFEADENGLAFTGIQVLSPEIFNFFPSKKIFSSIEVYKSLMAEKKVKAYVAKDIYWSDIGTKQSYAISSLLELTAQAFDIRRDKIKHITVQKLAGDGSDRQWYRVVKRRKARDKEQEAGDKRQDNEVSSYDTELSYIIGDHGICLPGSESEKQLNAFIRIGAHLFSKGIPVPRILNYDKLSGMVIMDDLGDVHLASHIKTLQSSTELIKLYQSIIDQVIRFSSLGLEGFDTAWTCQTSTYSKELILEKECRYFMEAYINGYLNLKLSFANFEDEFIHIADQALMNGKMGLMHRDCQSKNIMLNKNRPFFIDFQAARIGPLQYDLASLLIDPYANLSKEIQNKLLEYTIEQLKLSTAKARDFRISYRFCSLSRNLQILGAFSFLSQIRQKAWFEQYIPLAVRSLKSLIREADTNSIPNLAELIQI
jgi:NDP-sugar pyrophosphorylase family protein/thiamine kinase-like enzyme